MSASELFNYRGTSLKSTCTANKSVQTTGLGLTAQAFSFCFCPISPYKPEQIRSS